MTHAIWVCVLAAAFACKGKGGESSSSGIAAPAEQGIAAAQPSAAGAAPGAPEEMTAETKDTSQ